MASLGHVAVGLLAGRLHGASTPRRTLGAMAGFAGLAMLPDCDVVPLAMGVPDVGLMGHRGITHTFTFALCLAVAVALLARRLTARPLYTAVFVFVVLASHGPFDALTHDSRGVPLLWPLSSTPIAFDWRPIPVAPTGLKFLSVRGFEVALVELIYFSPLFGIALWPRGGGANPPTLRRAVAACAAITVAAASCLILAELTLRDIGFVSRLDRGPTPSESVAVKVRRFRR